jgi:hypothetical protein
MDTAVVGAAVSLTLDAGGVCADGRLVLGAVLVGRKLDETALATLDEAARLKPNFWPAIPKCACKS